MCVHTYYNAGNKGYIHMQKEKLNGEFLILLAKLLVYEVLKKVTVLAKQTLYFNHGSYHHK